MVSAVTPGGVELSCPEDSADVRAPANRGTLLIVAFGENIPEGGCSEHSLALQALPGNGGKGRPYLRAVVAAVMANQGQGGNHFLLKGES